MKKEDRDLRITVNGTRTILYIIILCVTSALNSAFLFLNIKLWNMLLPGPLIYSIMGAFVILSSGILVFVIWIIYRQFIIKPLDKVRLAAKQVAAGDFSARIPQHRKDGKKDEFQILYDDFNMMATELASTEIMKTDFISNVSHELKTPISVIQNFFAMLQSEGITDDERKQYALKIHAATKRLSILVTDILQLKELIYELKNSVKDNKYLIDSFLSTLFSSRILEKVYDKDSDFDYTDIFDERFSYRRNDSLSQLWSKIDMEKFKSEILTKNLSLFSISNWSRRNDE